jgi:hypothetical protein
MPAEARWLRIWFLAALIADMARFMDQLLPLAEKVADLSGIAILDFGMKMAGAR